MATAVPFCLALALCLQNPPANTPPPAPPLTPKDAAVRPRTAAPPGANPLGEVKVPPAVLANEPLLTPPAEPPLKLASFAEALRKVRAGSDTFAIVAARVRVAEAQSRQALATLLPTLQGSAGVHYDLLHPDQPPPIAGASAVAVNGQGAATTPLGVGQLSFQMPLVNARLWQARAAAQASEQASRAEFADAQRSLLLDLGSTLVTVLSGERAAELQREGLRNALERQYLVERTLELGSGTRLDLVRAQQDTSLARADVILGREQITAAREALGLLLGSDKPIGIDSGVGQALPADIVSVCPRVPVVQRPDVVAARLRLRSAQELVDEARAQYFPSLGLQSATSALTVKDPGPFRVPAWTISAVLDVPIWDGGGRGARLAERRFLSQIAEAQARLVAREADVDVARSRRGVQVAQALLAQAQSARDLARDADRMTRRAFEGGDATSFELVQSAQALRQAELALAARQFNLDNAAFSAVVAEASCNF